MAKRSLLKRIILSPVTLYFILVNYLICWPLSLPKRKNGSRLITANMITIGRVAIFIPIAICYLSNREYLKAIIYLTLSYIGDTADGEYARNFGKISDFGALLDRACDKAGNIAIILAILLSNAVFLAKQPGVKEMLLILALIEGFALFYSIRWEFLNRVRFEISSVMATSIGKFKMAAQSINLVALIGTELIEYPAARLTFPESLILVAICLISAKSLIGHIAKIGA